MVADPGDAESLQGAFDLVAGHRRIIGIEHRVRLVFSSGAPGVAKKWLSSKLVVSREYLFDVQHHHQAACRRVPSRP
jgi:hypothetical protein